MGYCLGQVLCVIIFSQLLRYAQHRRADVMEVSAVNYVVAAGLTIVAAWCAGALGELPQRWPEGLFGGGVGVVFFMHLLMLLAAYRIAGVGVTVALASLGVLVPVLVSWLVWSEPMPAWRWLAVGLFAPAVFLMRPMGGLSKRLTLAAEAVLAGVFLGAGIAGTMHKTVNMAWPAANHLTYQAAVFAVAAMLSVAYVRYRRLRYTPPAFVLGSAMGTLNALALLLIIAALGVLEAAVVFPITSSLIIVGSVVVSRLLWAERISRRQVVGVVLAMIAVVLARV